MIRLLLPFTSGVEMDVLESLVHLASCQRATLIPLSLIPLPVARRKGVRLELLQQSKDFLEAVRHKAAQHHVPIEPAEVFTHDVVQSILTSFDQLHCDSILLASRETHSSLLHMEVTQQLLQINPCPLCLVYFPTRQRGGWMAKGGAYLARWWTGIREHQVIQGTPSVSPLTDFQELIPLPGEKRAKEQENSADMVPLMPVSDQTVTE